MISARVSAKVDNALRAAAELAAAGDGPRKGEQLENNLLELRHHGLVQSQRGVEASC
jgi:hypothetical protein